jgi:hypothetical protein
MMKCQADYVVGCGRVDNCGGHFAFDFDISLGKRYIGFEGSSDETAWLIDRLTGAAYRCHALEQDRAACEEPITGAIKK